MKKSINKIIGILIIISCICTAISNNKLTSYAKQKDVTNSVSNKKDIIELTQIFVTPCGYDLTELMKKGKTKKYDFSKSKDRRNILDLCYEEIYNENIGERALSVRMFGESTSDVDLLIGDWGYAYPEIKIKKIYQISSKQYKVLANVNWYNGETKKSKKIGLMRLYLTKDSNSYYGYIARSMKLQKTADI